MKDAFIYDLNGKLLLSISIENNSITVDSLSTGSYILILKDSNDKGYTQKFIKE
jgi:hypothetical protein